MSELNEIIEKWEETIIKSRKNKKQKTIQSLESRMSQIDKLLEMTREKLKKQQEQIINDALKKQEELSLLNYSNEVFVDSWLVSGYDLVELVAKTAELVYEEQDEDDDWFLF